MKLNSSRKRWGALVLITVIALLKINWLGMAALCGFLLAYLGKGLRKHTLPEANSRIVTKKSSPVLLREHGEREPRTLE